VLALESADLATVGASAPQLQAAFGISETQLGLLAAVSTFVGAIATVPFGALVDRVNRTRLLAVAIAIWAAAMALGAAAESYRWLLLTRVGLGAVTAVAAPAIASLTGDLFPASERGKVYGYVLSGELLGAAIGFVVCGSVASALSWRWGFAVLAPPALILAVTIRRLLPEPGRGGGDRLVPEGGAREAVLAHDVEPVPEHVVTGSRHQRMSLPRAVVYVLRIATNRWLIVASAIGYFFFAGLRTFALVFIRGHFSLGQGAATAVLFIAGLGAVTAVLVSGRTADRMIARGRLDARLVVAAIAYLVSALCLIPVVATTSLALAVPFLLLAGAGLSAPNPPVDAARLDVVPSWLWGRAEGVRTLVRQSAQAAAPLVFGAVADAFAGGHVSSSAQAPVSATAAHGLTAAFTIMLVPLALSGVVLLLARRGYPADVATAAASEQPAPPRRRRQPRHRPVRQRDAPTPRPAD
jgi:MFS family permease